jgi:hypothetical protein
MVEPRMEVPISAIVFDPVMRGRQVTLIAGNGARETPGTVCAMIRPWRSAIPIPTVLHRSLWFHKTADNNALASSPTVHFASFHSATFSPNGTISPSMERICSYLSLAVL